MATLSIHRQEKITAYVFIAPVLLIIAGLMFYPIINVVRLSFLNASFINRSPEFVGFQNYIELLQTSSFWQIMQNSVVWTVGVVFLQFVIGFGFALFLNSFGRGQGVSRSLVLIPWVIPGVVAGIVWKIMYHPQIGIVNPLLQNLGIITDQVAFLSKETTAMPAVIAAAVWKGFPYNTVTLLAGLQSVRQDLIDCAKIDGAGPIKRLLNVIVPQLSGIIRINLMLTTIWTFNYFDITYSMTNGGPNQATQIFPLEIYKQAFGELRYSYSSALAVISLVVIFIFTMFYIRNLFRSEEQ
jgi:multiple sugar transport system permease protein